MIDFDDLPKNVQEKVTDEALAQFQDEVFDRGLLVRYVTGALGHGDVADLEITSKLQAIFERALEEQLIKLEEKNPDSYSSVE